MLSSSELQRRIAAFCERSGWSTSSFGRRALNDPNFWSDLTDPERPRFPTERTVKKLTAFMEDYDGSKRGKSEARHRQ